MYVCGDFIEVVPLHVEYFVPLTTNDLGREVPVGGGVITRLGYGCLELQPKVIRF